jgi:hypothetical protein
VRKVRDSKRVTYRQSRTFLSFPFVSRDTVRFRSWRSLFLANAGVGVGPGGIVSGGQAEGGDQGEINSRTVLLVGSSGTRKTAESLPERALSG